MLITTTNNTPDKQ